VLQTLYTLSDDATEYQLKDRLSFMRFCMTTQGEWPADRTRSAPIFLVDKETWPVYRQD
jgi:IS5 family transposase